MVLNNFILLLIISKNIRAYTKIIALYANIKYNQVQPQPAALWVTKTAHNTAEIKE